LVGLNSAPLGRLARRTAWSVRGVVAIEGVTTTFPLIFKGRASKSGFVLAGFPLRNTRLQRSDKAAGEALHLSGAAYGAS